MPHNHDTAAAAKTAVVVDRSRQVRSRLSRGLVPLLIAAIVLCGVVVWLRDAKHIITATERMQPYLTPLHRHLQEHHSLPTTYPSVSWPDGSDRADFVYADPRIIEWAQTAGRPAVIGYAARSTGLIVRHNGRGVAVFENGQVRAEWMSGADLDRTLAEQQKLASAAPTTPPAGT